MNAFDPEEGGSGALTRRERAKRDKRERIFRAAADLFARHGYTAVTTEQIADAADVGAGTVFRYFPTKAELLVAVMNEQLRVGIERGLDAAAAGAAPEEAILALLEPLVVACLEHPENTRVYQRESLFSPGPVQEGTTQRVAQIPEAIHRILERHAARHPLRQGVDLHDAAEAIYATMLMNVVRVTAGRTAAGELSRQLRHSVRFLLDALLDAGG